jgi:Zn-dependent peptidase ImmA (M78 family)
MATGEAVKLWRRYGWSTPKELVLEDLGFVLGVIIFEDRLDSADARLVRKRDRGLIRIRSDIPQRGRKRYAAAHELGHWLLHKQLSQILACTSDEMSGNYKGSEPEIEANWFAAELLMPERLFGAAIMETPPNADTINSLADEYGTTCTATAVRFVELSREHCAMIIAENGRVRWWRASEEFERSMWIKPGLAVSERTLAGRFFQAGSVPKAVQEIGIDEWADRYPDFAEFVFEAAIPLGRSGQVLTMLWVG